MSRVSESIWSNDQYVIPMADVMYVERSGHTANHSYVILKGTTYNAEAGDYNNAPILKGEDVENFKRDFCQFIAERDSDILKNLEPKEVG